MRATPPPNQDRRSRPRRRRGAFSLIEVILALAILCGALATLGELSRLGMREAEKARDLTQAQLLCESKLSEITAGVTPLEAQEDAPFESTDEEDSESEWVYSIAVTPGHRPTRPAVGKANRGVFAGPLGRG
jgi:general secretion pathway protein I